VSNSASFSIVHGEALFNEPDQAGLRERAVRAILASVAP
jgi:hypothetical protein